MAVPGKDLFREFETHDFEIRESVFAPAWCRIEVVGSVSAVKSSAVLAGSSSGAFALMGCTL